MQNKTITESKKILQKIIYSNFVNEVKFSQGSDNVQDIIEISIDSNRNQILEHLCLISKNIRSISISQKKYSNFIHLLKQMPKLQQLNICSQNALNYLKNIPQLKSFFYHHQDAQHSQFINFHNIISTLQKLTINNNLSQKQLLLQKPLLYLKYLKFSSSIFLQKTFENLITNLPQLQFLELCKLLKNTQNNAIFLILKINFLQSINYINSKHLFQIKHVQLILVIYSNHSLKTQQHQQSIVKIVNNLDNNIPFDDKKIQNLFAQNHQLMFINYIKQLDISQIKLQIQRDNLTPSVQCIEIKKDLLFYQSAFSSFNIQFFLTPFPNPKILRLNYFVDYLSMTSLKSISKIRNLEQLQIQTCGIVNKGMIYLKRNKSLKKIRMQYNQFDTGIGIQLLMNLKNLQKYSMDYGVRNIKVLNEQKKQVNKAWYKVY